MVAGAARRGAPECDVRGWLAAKLRSAAVLAEHAGVARTALRAITAALWRLRVGRAGYIIELDLSDLAPLEGGDAPTLSPIVATAADLHGCRIPAEANLALDLIDDRLGMGDRCIALIDDTGTLRAFRLHTTAAVRQFGGCWAPGPGYSLGHHVWVDRSLRGGRITFALLHAWADVARGIGQHGIVGTVEVTNYAQLRSVKRMGYRRRGLIIQLGPEWLNLGFAISRSRLFRRVRAPRASATPT